MTSMIPSGRRRVQFRLRTLFGVVTAAAILLAILAYHLDWIRQRHALLVPGGIAAGDGPNDAEIYEPSPPGLLKLLGENAYGYIIVFPDRALNDLTATEQEKVRRVKGLFPEARVDACWPDSSN